MALPLVKTHLPTTRAFLPVVRIRLAAAFALALVRKQELFLYVFPATLIWEVLPVRILLDVFLIVCTFLMMNECLHFPHSYFFRGGNIFNGNAVFLH